MIKLACGEIQSSKFTKLELQLLKGATGGTTANSIEEAGKECENSNRLVRRSYACRCGKQHVSCIWVLDINPRLRNIISSKTRPVPQREKKKHNLINNYSCIIIQPPLDFGDAGRVRSRLDFFKICAIARCQYFPLSRRMPPPPPKSMIDE